ncbi:SIMPL domain-containing protein [Neptunitalea lumnitzerae]|uniref:DUF541 domain-containing protein n=1 Tax=Neptunitalea lumnitzerae TaxID=2965509 RepID=A0ABQ5MMN6_9FLAO|nr:SIMPL domain-containing protein [Neptunitalea sp. Y10]GLB50657.1 hypothetical protein Y10_30250 [Neptunitalea sp. Y10]
MKHVFLSVVVLLISIQAQAQVKGNANYQPNPNLVSRANLATTQGYLQKQVATQNLFNNPTSSNISITTNALCNVKAAKYVAVFNISQVGKTTEQTNKLLYDRINAIKNTLFEKGVSEEDIVTDVISFIPNYEVTVEKKLFSKKYVEIPTGFELQVNLHIGFKNIALFEDILTSCAANEVYNLVKVDYVIDNIENIYKTLQEKIITSVKSKKEYYNSLGITLDNYNIEYAEQKYCYTPKDFYQSFQAFNSISMEAITKSNGITQAKKQTSYYYQPLENNQFDIVINPTIIEPVIQVVLSTHIKYTPKPKDVSTPEKQYILISPTGEIATKTIDPTM